MTDAKSAMLCALEERFQNLTITLTCTLEEFYHGCMKTINFERITLIGEDLSHPHSKMMIVKKDIHVKPGMGNFTWLTFPGEGHQRVG